MKTLDEACEQWLARLLDAAPPLGAAQLDLIKRTYGCAPFDHDIDAVQASEAA